MVAAFTSCKKTYISQTPNQTYFVTVKASSWTQTADGKSDSVSIKAPAIDNFFNDNGATLVYFSFFKGVYEQIPEVYNNVSYSYFHYPGNLVLYSQPATGGTPVKPTDDIVVKLVLIPSE
ncbi:MAG TPA: hypothetical protein VL490_06510 [Mucilaginibacter sp.]|jgi:hypothetical protein|nr:hypothetical protein [Mucilaginibacter sp.]